MLNVKIVCVGTLREDYLRLAAREYEKRLQGYCKLATAELKDESRLAQSIEGKSYKIALCVEGKQASSEELADLLEKGTVSGQGSITLVIGGADGLPEHIKAMCDYRLSFSRMTFPHQLMRVILLEQLYRALNILGGGHYHH